MSALGQQVTAGSDSTWDEALVALRTVLKPNEFRELLNISSLEQLLRSMACVRQQRGQRLLGRMLAKTLPWLEHLKTFSDIIDTFVQTNPQISGLIWGSLKFVLQV
jgi:hypothetical protein